MTGFISEDDLLARLRNRMGKSCAGTPIASYQQYRELLDSGRYTREANELIRQRMKEILPEAVIARMTK